MPYVEQGKPVGGDNRAAGSPAGEENLVAGTYSPAPLQPMESGDYDAAVSVSSISRSSNTGTVTTGAAHGWSIGQVVRFLGANQAAYNREFQLLTLPTDTTATFTVYGSPTSPATGTITARLKRGPIDAEIEG